MKTNALSKVNYQEDLNKEQIDIIKSVNGPSLIIAGAGTGKTRMLVYKVCYLIDQGVPLSSILLVTFTNKAAKEMIQRVESLLGFYPHELWAGTFHHIANKLLRRYGEAISLNTGYTIIDSEDSLAIFKEIMSQWSEDDNLPSPVKVKKLISLSSNTCLKLEEVVNRRFPQYSPLQSILEDIAGQYKARKLGNNVLDYDDLLEYWHKLMKNKAVCETLCGLFDYILVDEYHDTNTIQGKILKSVAGEKKNITVVGDDAQSIYSFRGATVDNIIDFPKTYIAAKVFYMNSNYRSTPQIIKLANDVISYNTVQFPKKLSSMRKNGVKPLVVKCYNRKSEADFVTQRVVQLLDSGIKPGEIGILFRSKYQSAELEMELNKFKIFYVMRGGLRFFEQAHIKDILAYFKVVANFNDSIAWKRLLGLTQGVGSKTAEKVLAYIEHSSGKEDLKREIESFSKKIFTNMNELLILLENIESSPDIPKGIDLIMRSSYSQHLEKKYDDDKERREEIESLKEISVYYDDLATFLAESTLQENYKGEQSALSSPVVLSTIHQAKGLEWKIVFIIGVSANHFPHQYSESDIRALEEERRIFYVGITRAKEDLYITYYTRDFFRTFPGEISPFIENMHPDLCEEWNF